MLGRFALLAALACGAVAADVAFTPLAAPDGSFDSERNTGEWFRPDLGTAADIVPLKTRLCATRESVTGGVGMKWVFEPGSTGLFNFEKSTVDPDTAGITFFAKASRPIRFRVCADRHQDVVHPITIGAEWAKYDVPWSDVRPDGMWLLVFQVLDPIDQRTTLWLDRVGVEGPTFDPKPAIAPQSGPDQAISSHEILLGAEHLAATVARLKAKRPFSIVAFGDSITDGAQTNRGTWGVPIADGVAFRYFGHVAHLLEQTYGCTGITPVCVAHGGWTTQQLLGVVEQDLLPRISPGDLVMLQSGGNDICAGATPTRWREDIARIIAKVRTKTDQIIVLSPNAAFPGPVYDQAEALSAALRELVAAEHVAGADITRFITYRGPAFASALFANPYHPDFMGHIEIGRMIAPLLTGRPATYPDE